MKYGWSTEAQKCILEVGPDGLHQLDETGVAIKTYPYNYFKQIYRVNNCQGGFVIEIGEQMRRHMFASQTADKLIQECRTNASEYVGVYIPLAKEPLSFDDFGRTRLGLCRFDYIFAYPINLYYF
jgi:hypothetical protein